MISFPNNNEQIIFFKYIVPIIIIYYYAKKLIRRKHLLSFRNNSIPNTIYKKKTKEKRLKMKAIRNFTRTDWALGIVTILLVASGVGNILLGINLGLLQIAPGEDKILLFGTTVGPTDIDPANCYDTGGSDVITQVCEGLYKFNLSDPAHDIVPVLATELPELQGLNLSIDLRQGVTFHDGTPFNAAAVKWNFDRLMHFLNYSGNDWLPAPFNVSVSDAVGTTAIAALITGPGGVPLINKTTITSEYSVNITLNYATGFLLPLFAYSGLYFVSPTATPANTYISPYTWGGLVGTGPFEFSAYNYGLSVILTANEDYWQGAPAIDGVNFVIYTSQTSMNDALLSKDIHLTDAVQTTYVSTFGSNADITLDTAGGSINSNYLAFHCELINETWREAIAYAINYDYIVDVDLLGEAYRLKSPIPAGVLYSNFSTTPDMNVTHARIVMQSMGFGTGLALDNDAGWEAASFRTMEITVQNDNDDRQNAAATIANNLASIGIVCTTSEIEFDTLVDYLVYPSQHDNMEMHVVGWSPDFIDPDNYVEYAFHSQSGLCQNYSNSEVDQLIEDGQEELDYDARKAIYDRLQEIVLSEDFAQAPLFVGKSYDAYLNTVTGWVCNNIGRVDFYPVNF